MMGIILGLLGGGKSSFNFLQNILDLSKVMNIDPDTQDSSLLLSTSLNQG